MKEQEHYAESVRYSIDRTKASLQELAHDFLSSDLLKGLIEGANTFLQIVDKIISSLGTVGTLITGFGTASAIKGLATGDSFVGSLINKAMGDKGTGDMRSNLKTLIGLGGNATREVESVGADLIEGVAGGATSAASRAFEPAWKNATRTMANVDGELVEVWFDAQNNVIHNMDNLSDIALRNGTAAGTAAASGFGSTYTAGVAGATAEANATMTAGAGVAGTEAGGAAATGFAAAFNPIVIAAIAGVGILIGKAIYDHVQNVQHKAATTATDKYNERKEQVTGYKDRYETLYKDLHDSSKSEAERVQIREQILGLQQEITGAYGAEAAAVDLVNGELREQLNIMDGLVDKQIEKNNKDPNVKKGYADAKKAMTDTDKYDFGEILDGSKISEELRTAMEAIDGVTLADGMEGTGTKIIRFEGDATGAKKAAGEVQEVLDEMRQKYVDDDEVGAVIQHVNDTMIPESNRLNDLLDRHHANYMSALEQELTTQQRKDIDELGQAIKDVNTAAASGEGFEEAYDSYVEKLNRIKLDSEHQPIVDQLKEGLDDASIKAQNFYDILDGDDHIGKSNEFKERADSIKQYSESLKELELEGIDVKEVLNDPLKSTNKGRDQILSLAKAFGALGDDMKVNEGMVDSFITSLKNAGIVADSVADTIEGTTEGSFKSFQSSIINDIANMDTINSALVNSFSGKGLTFAIDENTNKLVGDIDTVKNAYAELADEFDLSKLFERTANGVKVNVEEQRKLQSILESRNKQKFIDEENRLLREQASLEERIAGIQDTEMFADRYEKLSNELSSVQGELENVRNLKAAYEGATSAYQKYLDAQNLPSEGAIYENLRDTTISRGDELLKNGYLGQEFRSIAQLFSYEDLSSAPIEEVSAAYTKGRDAIKGFFTENADGIVKFAEQIKKLDPAEYGFVTGSAEEGYNFFGLNNDKLAEYFGVSVDIIDAMFGRFEQFGYQFTEFDAEQNATFRAIKANIDATQKSFKDLDGDLEISVGGNKKSVSDVVNFDIAEIGNDADALRTKLSELSALKGLGPQIGTENLELVDSLIQEILRNLQLIDDTKVEPGQVNLEGIEQGEREIQAFTEAFNKTEETNKKYGLELTVEGNTQAMAAVDWFMNNPELAAAMKIDISGGKESVIEQLTELAKNGGIQTTVDADVNTGNVQEEVSSAVSGASGTPDVNVDEGNVASQTEEGIKNADGTTVTPEVNASSVQSETESALNTATNKTYKAKVTVDNHSLSQQIRSAVSKSQPKSTKTTNETVTKETKETNIKTEVSGNAEADLAQLQSMASKPMNVKINVDTNADVAVAKLQSIAHTHLEGKLKISVDDSEVKSWKAPDKTGMVKYFVNGGNVSAWSPPEKAGYVRYNVTGTSPVYNWQPPKKTGTVSYNVKADGTAHWQGTAGGYYSPKRNGSIGNSFINHYNGTAYARGNWGLKRDEPNALINELGPEIVVRDGQWMIANNGFPTLADSPKGIPGGLQKGDIVFNHKQAEDILKHGYVTGTHARLVGGGAHAQGTAFGNGTGPSLSKYTSGGGGGNSGGGNTYIGKQTNNYYGGAATTTTTTTTTTTKKKASTKGNASLIPDNISVETFDFIEIKLKRLEDQISDFKRTADSAFKSFAARATATASELDSVTEAIAANETAIVKYEARAETTLRTGKYRLTGREKKQAKKAGIGNSVDEIRDNLVKGAFKISDIKTNSDVQKKYDSAKTKRDKAKKGTKEWNKQNKKLKKLKSKLKNEKAKESLKNKLSQFQEWIDKAEEASNQAEELREQQKELYQQQFELARTEYEGKLNPLETRSGLMESWISENENKGNYTSTKVYETLAANEQSKYNTLLEERGVLIKKLQDAIAGGIAINGEEYNEMQSAINDVTKSLYEAKASQEEFNKKVRELEYENFKNLQDRISNVSEELSFLADIMSENPMFGEKGTFTEYGIATLGVYATQYEIAMKQAEEYTDKIQRLQSIINGTYKASANESVPGIKEAREQLVELQSSQRSVIKSAYDMRKSIKSLVEDGFKEEINSIKDIISEYEKMLDTQKSEYDYSKKITEQQEKITSLRRQIASWGNDSSEEGAAKRQKAEKELRDAEQTLQETQEERRISQIKEMLSDMQDQYEKLFNGRTDEVTVLIDNILNSIGNYQGNIGSTLSNVIGKSKLTKSSELEDLLKKFNEEAAVPIEKSLETGVTISGLMGAGDSVIGGISSVSTINSGIESKVDGILSKLKETWKMEITNADQIAVQISNKINTDSANTQPEQKTSSGSSGSSTGGVTGANSKTLTTSVAKSVNQNHADEARKYIQKKASKAKKKRKEYSDVNKKIYDMTGGKVLSTDELKSLAKKIGTTYNGADSKNNLYKRLKTLKVFKRGTRRVQDNDYYWTQEGRGQNELITRKSDGAMLTRLGSGDMVFNAEMTKTLWNFAKDPVPFMTNGTIKAPDVSSNITYGDSNIDITFNVPNVTNADEFMRTLQKSKKFEQIVQSMTIGRIQGKGTLNKYNTRI